MINPLHESNFKKLISEILPGGKYDVRFTYSCEDYSDDEFYSFDIYTKNNWCALTVNFCCDGDWITEITIHLWDDEYKNLFWQVRKKLESVLSKKYPIFADSTKWAVEFIPDMDGDDTMEGSLVYSHTDFKYWLDLEQWGD